MMNYSMDVNQLRREDGKTTKTYYIQSVLNSINGYETDLSLNPVGPAPSLSAQQIIFYVFIGGFVVLIGVVIVGMVRAPSDKQER